MKISVPLVMSLFSVPLLTACLETIPKVPAIPSIVGDAANSQTRVKDTAGQSTKSTDLVNSKGADAKVLMDRVYITSILLALAEANLIQAFADIEAATGDTKKSDQLKKQAELVLDFRSKIDGIMKPEEVKVTKASERLKDHDKVIETVDRLPGGPHRAQIMKAFQKLQIAVAYNRAALDQAQEIVMNPPGARDLLDPRIADLFGIISGLPSEAKEQINLVGEIGTALGKYLETRAFSPPTPEEVRVAIKKESSRQIDRFKKINEKRWPGELNKAAGDKLADLAKKAADGIIEESVFPGSSSSWSSLLGA